MAVDTCRPDRCQMIRVLFRALLLFVRLASQGRTENGSWTDVVRFSFLLSRTLSGLSKLPDHVQEVAVRWNNSRLTIALFYLSDRLVASFVVRSYTGQLADILYRFVSQCRDPRFIIIDDQPHHNDEPEA